MSHFVKHILPLLDYTVTVAVTLAIFMFIKILNYIAHCGYYFYLLACVVFHFLTIHM